MTTCHVGTERQISLTMQRRCLCEQLYYRTEVIQTDASFAVFFLQAVASACASLAQLPDSHTSH